RLQWREHVDAVIPGRKRTTPPEPRVRVHLGLPIGRGRNKPERPKDGIKGLVAQLPRQTRQRLGPRHVTSFRERVVAPRTVDGMPPRARPPPRRTGTSRSRAAAIRQAQTRRVVQPAMSPPRA